EPGPVNPLLEFFVRLKGLLESERELRWTMLIEICQAFRCLVNARNMASGNPPQRGINARKLLEPLLPLPKQLSMSGMVNVASERFNRFPNRHIDQDPIVVRIRPKIGCV